MKKRLSEVEAGTRVTIDSFENDDVFLKLMEMGLVPGETVVIEQIAPLGDPISVSVAGYQLSLRINEAYMIWVEEMGKEPVNIIY
jgi:ferrous iron transport protein A